MFLQRTELLIGSDNIEKLKNSNVIVFGLGGVGGATVEALVRAGIGNLSIVDFDTVDKTNLNRQIITTQSVIGKAKVEVARDRILSINPNINLTIYNEKILDRNTVDADLCKYGVGSEDCESGLCRKQRYLRNRHQESWNRLVPGAITAFVRQRIRGRQFR